MRSIVILGAGELGGALARQLAAADIADEIVMVDPTVGVAEGKALDIRQAAPIDGYSTTVTGSSDEARVVAADAIVLADHAGGGGDEWQGEPGLALVRRLAHLNAGAPILCAGASQIEIIEGGVREGGIARRRLFGSAPEALRSAIVSMTALEAACAPGDVCLTVIGRPPAQIIVPWEGASIAGRRAVDVLPPPAITRLDNRLPRFWPPGALTLAAAARRVLTVAATRRSDAVSAFVSVTREEGDRGRVGMLPVTVDPRGIARVLAPALNARDRVRFDTAMQR